MVSTSERSEVRKGPGAGRLLAGPRWRGIGLEGLCLGLSGVLVWFALRGFDNVSVFLGVGAVLFFAGLWAARRPVDHGAPLTEEEISVAEIEQRVLAAFEKSAEKYLDPKILKPRKVAGGLERSELALYITEGGRQGRGAVAGGWALKWPKGLADGTEIETGRFRVDVTWRLFRRSRVKVGEVHVSSDVFSNLLEMIPIPSGTFLMGSPKEDEWARTDEKPQHPHHLDAFSLARTPTTEGQWAMVMGEDWPQQPDLPKVEVSWNQALAFCQRLSLLSGAPLAYSDASDEAEWTGGRESFRLPTEAEWEYACRAGTTTRYSFGDDPGDLHEYAWSVDNSKGSLSPVSTKAPNPWGLVDMHGLVLEWCFSGHQNYPVDAYPHRPVGAFRVLRGGSFFFPALLLRSAHRDWYRPGFRPRSGGFRCAGPSSPSSLNS